ncbi:MAG: hypothetical protein HQK54_10650 [Oligoflexales bacterium]|nr:hypothetical protein [Oligoflexales bacterium]
MKRSGSLGAAFTAPLKQHERNGEKWWVVILDHTAFSAKVHTGLDVTV